MTVSPGPVSIPLRCPSRREILRQLKKFFTDTNTAWLNRKDKVEPPEEDEVVVLEPIETGSTRAKAPGQGESGCADGKPSVASKKLLHPGYLIAANCVTDEITISEDRKPAPANTPVWPLIHRQFRPPVCKCSDDVEDLLDRIERLRRDGLFYSAVINLVTARAEWLYVQTGGRHTANGFRPAAEIRQGSAAPPLTPLEMVNGWGLPPMKKKHLGRAMPAVNINPQEFLEIPEIHVVPESPRVSLPDAWCITLAVEYETLASIGYKSPLSPHAEVYFTTQLVEIALLWRAQPGAIKDSIDEAITRVVWSLWHMYYLRAQTEKRNGKEDLVVSKIMASLGYVCYHLGEFSLARECFKNAKILRISYNTRRKTDTPMICPHVALWGHNEALALCAMGMYRKAYKLAWSAAEIMNPTDLRLDQKTRGRDHPESAQCRMTVESLNQRPDVAMSLSTGADVSPNAAMRTIKKADKRPKNIKLNRKRK